MECAVLNLIRKQISPKFITGVREKTSRKHCTRLKGIVHDVLNHFWIQQSRSIS